MSSGRTENARQTAKKDDTAAPDKRAHHGRRSAGAIASTASMNGRPPPERGSSKRSQSTAITSTAIPASTTVLAMCDLQRGSSLEAGREVVAGAHDRDRNA